MKQGKCSDVLQYYAKWPGDAVDSSPPSALRPGKVNPLVMWVITPNASSFPPFVFSSSPLCTKSLVNVVVNKHLYEQGGWMMGGEYWEICLEGGKSIII